MVTIDVKYVVASPFDCDGDIPTVVKYFVVSEGVVAGGSIVDDDVINVVTSGSVDRYEVTPSVVTYSVVGVVVGDVVNMVVSNIVVC